MKIIIKKIKSSILLKRKHKSEIQNQISMRNQPNKKRSFPPAIPLKLNKLLEYEYFSEIYKKYDCNFFRQIIPYFSEIITTDKLELGKYIYVPIQNFNKVPKIHIGLPFYPQNATQNLPLYQLQNQVTFIKIAYQVHINFEYLIKLSLTSFKIGRLNFQDKFWLFTEGVIKNYSFNEIVYKKGEQKSKSIIFILQGEFKCLNRQNKTFKTISRGYAIDANDRITKLRFEDKMKKSINKNDPPILANTTSDNKEPEVIGQKEDFYSLLSFSNNGKILIIDLNIVKKYTLIEESGKSGNQTPKVVETKPIIKMEKKARVQSLKKIRRLQTEKHQNSNAISRNELRSEKKKPNLFSCRSGTGTKNRIVSIPIQEIYDNQVVKSYTKESEQYRRMKKVLQFKKNKSNVSLNKSKESPQNLRKSQLLPFFKQQLQEEKEKFNLKRRKTRQLWGNGSIHYQEPNRNQTYFEQLTKSMQMPKTSNSYESNSSTKKLSKPELGSFYLLKRNLFNKEFHRAYLSQIIQ